MRHAPGGVATNQESQKERYKEADQAGSTALTLTPPVRPENLGRRR